MTLETRTILLHQQADIAFAQSNEAQMAYFLHDMLRVGIPDFLKLQLAPERIKNKTAAMRKYHAVARRDVSIDNKREPYEESYIRIMIGHTEGSMNALLRMIEDEGISVDMRQVLTETGALRSSGAALFEGIPFDINSNLEKNKGDVTAIAQAALQDEQPDIDHLQFGINAVFGSFVDPLTIQVPFVSLGQFMDTILDIHPNVRKVISNRVDNSVVELEREKAEYFLSLQRTMMLNGINRDAIAKISSAHKAPNAHVLKRPKGKYMTQEEFDALTEDYRAHKNNHWLDTGDGRKAVEKIKALIDRNIYELQTYNPNESSILTDLLKKKAHANALYIIGTNKVLMMPSKLKAVVAIGRGLGVSTIQSADIDTILQQIAAVKRPQMADPQLILEVDGLLSTLNAVNRYYDVGTDLAYYFTDDRSLYKQK